MKGVLLDRLIRKARAAGLPLLLVFTSAMLWGCDSNESKGNVTRANPVTPTQPDINIPAPVPQPVPPDTLPFAEDELNVAGAFPGPDESRVALVSPITVEFDAELMTGVDLETVILVRSPDGAVAGTVTSPSGNTLVFRPANLWEPLTTYTVTVDSALMSVEGLQVNSDLRWGFVTAADVYTTPQNVIDQCMSDLDEEMLAAVNQARSVARSCGNNRRAAVGKLSWNCLLQQAAITHSEDMARNNFFEHTGSDGSQVADRITRTGYVWSHAGENLAAGQRTVSAVMTGLLNSPNHCENIMSPNFTEFGFGYRFNADTFYQRYWTQNFARPFGR